ncbi:MAG: flagellar motor protein MotB [Stenotrophomonas sp.]
MSETKPTVIIRRVKKIQPAGHHGGSWKVAYADFVTAMMAFFLVLWLLATTSKPERAAISEYFRNPSPLTGTSPVAAPGMAGPGGASTSMIKLGGTTDLSRGTGDAPFEQQAKASAEAEERLREKQRLETLMQDLREAISKSQALEPFKDQLLLDITPEGLRIQIVDQQNRPMFDMGSARLMPYTRAILFELSQFINQVPNHISLTGHTDITAYAGTHGYSNWELSADRANAARRTLLEGGMDEAKVSRVVGLASSVLFDKQNPQNPINRRISIVVMTRDAEAAALADTGTLPLPARAPAATHGPAPDVSPAPATPTSE